MNSKQAFKELKENAQEVCEWELDRLNIIEKDLELLDIIKFLIKKGDIVVNSDLFVDYPELYEWLEQNEWNINKSNKVNQCNHNIDKKKQVKNI